MSNDVSDQQLPHAGKAPGDRDRRIPSLDGLRAMSILFVILAHASVTAGFPHRVFTAIAPFDLGNFGVRVFFAISGFLITRLLLEENARHGRINLPHFYFRRVFRIFPAYFSYVAVVAVLSALGWIPAITTAMFVHLVTFTLNFAREWTQAIGHFWSLAVEEQFYFLWPPMLAWLGLRRAFRAALGFVLLAPFLRLGLYLFVPAWHPIMSLSFPTVGDAIAVGCLLAWWRDDLWARDWYRRLLTSSWFALVPVAALAVTLVGGRPRIYYFAGMAIESLGIVLMLDWALRFPESRLGALLNARTMAWIGTLSYSLYVWQEIYLDSHFTSPWLRFPLNIVWVAVSGIASYYLIERPALRLRATLERRAAAARRQRELTAQAAS